MIERPGALQVGFAPGRLRRRKAGVDSNVIREELVLLCRCRAGALRPRVLRARVLRKCHPNADSTQSQNPFDHLKTPLTCTSQIILPSQCRACKLNGLECPRRTHYVLTRVIGFCMHFADLLCLPTVP